MYIALQYRVDKRSCKNDNADADAADNVFSYRMEDLMFGGVLIRSRFPDVLALELSAEDLSVFGAIIGHRNKPLVNGGMVPYCSFVTALMLSRVHTKSVVSTSCCLISHLRWCVACHETELAISAQTDCTT